MPPFPSSPRTAIGLGLLLHLAYLLAMFDTYFHSPIVQVAKSHPIETKDRLADRLVLLVADGLRADLVFTPSGSPRIPLEKGQVMAPNLRSIISNRGCFGLSHARVPTESRPGREFTVEREHDRELIFVTGFTDVALIGGLWEDPSAVFKGWKHNPVNFDSVLNQSSTSFTFGSPDILPIFGDPPADGKREDDPLDPSRKVLMWMYHEEDEDFTSDATRLDHFSFDKFSAVLQQGHQDAALDRRLRAPGTIFFLHLLGLDTTGHGYGPHSPEYIANIQVVDEIVRKVEREMQDYFADDRTAFLFTADHGMSNIGNHGDGHPDSTRTPFVAWGSGVRGPVPDPDSTSHDEVSRPWQFDHLVRRDVDQVDLTMLMAALSGTSWPKNSVGILPDDLLMPVSDPEHIQADLMLGNARSILEQFGTKHRRTSARKLFFRPFTKLLNLYGEDAFRSVQSMIKRGDYRAAAIESRTIAGLALEGLTYYDTYDQARLRNIVSLGYLSFSIYTLLYIRHVFGTSTPSRIVPMNTLALNTLSISLGILVLAGAAVERSPWHALYAAFPIYLVRAIIINLWETSGGAVLGDLTAGIFVTRLGQLGGFSLALIAMALGYQHRLVWSLGFIPLALILRGTGSSTRNQIIARSFPVILAAVWALFPVERNESLPILVLGGLINYAFTAMCFRKSCSTTEPAWKAAQRTFGVQLYFQGALSVYAIWAAYSLSKKMSLGPMTRGAGWILLAYSIVFPLASGFKAGQSANLRLALLYNTFSGSYLLLSQSWEILFLINYAVIVAIWMNGQRSAVPVDPSKPFRWIKSSDALRALAFLFLVHAGFFCTGNVASISSFYLGPVYRLIPVFQPAIMSTLLMYKIIVPFILLSAAFASICSSQHLPPFALILLTLAMSEPICLFFFRQVKTTGSWLEIGSSISHFAIASLLIAYNVFLYLIGDYVMRGTAPLTPAERPKID